ncbi:MAG: hypothetical protein C4548_16950 [Desulfobacteraceae bacterium]|jgi:hypothetical protein|nr:MAG: hypothetical protein C4548_16950 [Desulfobacteraceae bacterium]
MDAACLLPPNLQIGVDKHADLKVSIKNFLNVKTQPANNVQKKLKTDFSREVVASRVNDAKS